jgi:hypothetical protein
LAVPTYRWDHNGRNIPETRILPGCVVCSRQPQPSCADFCPLGDLAASIIVRRPIFRIRLCESRRTCRQANCARQLTFVNFEADAATSHEREASQTRASEPGSMCPASSRVYQADATPYFGPTSTGWIAPACGWRTHWITLSARPSNERGNVTPSALAVTSIMVVATGNISCISSGRFDATSTFI